MGGRLWRDASNRLACEWPGVEASDYNALCQAISDAFGLVPVSEPVIGLDVAFRDFRRGGQVIGLEWDNWMGFTAVAKSLASEPLIREIAAWLDSQQYDERVKDLPGK